MNTIEAAAIAQDVQLSKLIHKKQVKDCHSFLINGSATIRLILKNATNVIVKIPQYVILDLLFLGYNVYQAVVSDLLSASKNRETRLLTRPTKSSLQYLSSSRREITKSQHTHNISNSKCI